MFSDCRRYSHLVGTVVVADFFTHNENVGISSHFFVHGLVEGVSAGELRAFTG